MSDITFGGELFISVTENVMPIVLSDGACAPESLLSVSKDGAIQVHGREPKDDHEIIETLREWARRFA